MILPELLNRIDKNLLNSLLPFSVLYAETHFHLKFLKPLYYRKEPEIISDIPLRIIKKEQTFLPVLLIVKDADRFPIEMTKLHIRISHKNKNLAKEFELHKKIEERYFSEIFEVPLDEMEGDVFLKIDVFITYSINGKTKTVSSDNYQTLKRRSFRCFFSRRPLPYPPDWFAGEVHYHSNFTDDQVEFGADIPATKKMAKAAGLDWFFVTDHSYDLDDDESDFLKQDKNFPKWNKLGKIVAENDEESCRIIRGEEVSLGNAEGRNVHLLIIGDQKFREGAGDSAEIWFRNKPTSSITDITQNEKSLWIAAHPNEKVPFLQKLLLRRGNWQNADYQKNEIEYLQIINNASEPYVQRSISYWRSLLMQRYRFFILAGNDAHGNFNLMRQIKIPFLKLFSNRDQIFGNFHTAFQYQNNDPLNGLKKGRTIISNGPFLNFRLDKDGKSSYIGSTVDWEIAELIYKTGSIKEFGEVKQVCLFIGNYAEQKEKVILDPSNHTKISLPESGYLRMSLQTTQNGKAFTNPIWIGK